MNNKEQLKEIREMTYKRIHYGKEEQFTDKFQKKKKKIGFVQVIKSNPLPWKHYLAL